MTQHLTPLPHTTLLASTRIYAPGLRLVSRIEPMRIISEYHPDPEAALGRSRRLPFLREVGGIWFLACWRIRISFCLARKV
jgi:hypothetical protein